MTIQERLDLGSARLEGALSSLSPRDRALLLVMVVSLSLFGGWFAFSALNGAKRRAEQNLASTMQAQEQVNLLLARYAELQGDVAGLDARLAAGADFAPASFLETMGTEMGLSSNIKTIQERGTDETDHYRAQTVEFSVHDLKLGQIVDVLHKLETAPQAIRVTDLTVKADMKDRTLLDVRMQLAVLRPLEVAAP